MDGPETNVFWKRLDDGAHPGYAELARNGEKVFGPGDVVSFLYTGRSQFDPEARKELSFLLSVAR